MNALTPVPFSRRTLPTVPSSDPHFVWTTGADVQATWKRFGWTPPGTDRVDQANEKSSCNISQL
jgi:hypothetical protein